MKKKVILNLYYYFLKINGIHTKNYVFFIIIIIMTAGNIIINGG